MSYAWDDSSGSCKLMFNLPPGAPRKPDGAGNCSLSEFTVCTLYFYRCFLYFLLPFTLRKSNTPIKPKHNVFTISDRFTSSAINTAVSSTGIGRTGKTVRGKQGVSAISAWSSGSELSVRSEKCVSGREHMVWDTSQVIECGDVLNIRQLKERLWFFKTKHKYKHIPRLFSSQNTYNIFHHLNALHPALMLSLNGQYGIESLFCFCFLLTRLLF